MFIQKRKDLLAMEKMYAVPPQPVSGEDKRLKNARFRVLSGPGGFYVYDYLTMDVVKRDGKFFTTTSSGEAYGLLKTLPQESAFEAFRRKFSPEKAA